MALVTLLHERAMAERSPVRHVTLMPDGAWNLWIWTVVVEAPPGSPFEGARIAVRVGFPSDYPLSPPTITCERNTVYHPNVVTETGEVVFSKVRGAWVPDGSVRIVEDVLCSWRDLLLSPELNTAVEPDIAREFARDARLYSDKAARHLRNTALDL